MPRQKAPTRLWRCRTLARVSGPLLPPSSPLPSESLSLPSGGSSGAAGLGAAAGAGLGCSACFPAAADVFA